MESIHFNLDEGEILALIGEKGSGKTSLCRTICGIPNDYSRPVYVNNVCINDAKSAHNKNAIPNAVLFTPHDDTLFPDLTVAENIFLEKRPGSLERVNWNKLYSDVTKAFESLCIPDIRINSTITQLSNIQKYQVRLIKYYCAGVKFFVLDEMTRGLDPAEIEQLLCLLKELRNKGITVFYVPYRIEEISRIADKAAILERGGIRGEILSLKDVPYERIINIMTGQDRNANRFNEYFIGKYRITEREKEIITMIADGFSNQNISDQLSLSLGTIKNHIYNIFQKTNAKNRVDLLNMIKTKSPRGGI